MRLRHGSLFTGIGGFDCGFKRAGIETAWQCEIDPAARRVLERHWPDVPCHSDVLDVDGGGLEPVDVVTFGSPCQDLSTSGRRAGLGGDRSGLFFEALRIVREMRDATDDAAPRWACWENVPGAFSSNAGRDFAAVLDGLADIGAVDIGWRVLDAQWFGVAQRRRRLFVAADFGGRSTGEILALGQGVQGDPAPGRAAGPSVAALTASGVGTCGADDNQAQAGHLIAATVTAKWAKGTGGPAGDECQNLIVAVNARQTPVTAEGMTAGPLDTDGTTHAICFDLAQVTSPVNRSNPQPGDPAPALASTGRPHVASASTVRRLTPLECERLQGFPDGWTAPAGADTARYRTLGNAVCVPVAEWIGRNLAGVVR